MKKATIFCVILITLFISHNLFADGTEPEGSGTQADPYQIEILDNLLWVSTNSISWDAHFIQTADIDATDTQNWNGGEGFSPIGISEEFLFSGTYDGQDYTINGLYIDHSTSDYQALFGYAADMTIENLSVINVNVSGNDYVGGLVGLVEYNNVLGATIDNCYVSGSVEGNIKVGGLVGYYDFGSIISNCYSTCNITGNNKVGGLVGGIGSCDIAIHCATISNSYYNYEIVLINGENIITIGALDNEKFQIWINNGLELNIDNYLTSNGDDYLISSFQDFRQLLAFGQFPDYSFLLTSNIDLSDEDDFYIPYFACEFNGNGLVVDNLNISMHSFSYLGLFGYTNEASLEDIEVTNADVNGDDYIGCLTGYNCGSISNCNSSGNVSGNNYVGGLAGYSTFSLSSCSSIGNVDGNEKVGGLVGYFGGSMHNCYSNVDVCGYSNVGGLAGSTGGSYVAGHVNNCYSTGNVVGEDTIGGLVGETFGSYINKCYSSGNVSGDEFIGGLAGTGVYSWVTNSFWDIETSGQTTSSGGTGKTTAEMLDVATYTSLVTVGLSLSWDFVGNPYDDTGNNDYWDINDVINNGYPYFANSVTGIDEEETDVIPEVSQLFDNYPNPFNPSTSISFSIPDESKIELTVYNIKGQKVKQLVSDQRQVGQHSVVWYGKNDNGKAVSSGIYFYRLKTEDVNQTKRMLMLK